MFYIVAHLDFTRRNHGCVVFLGKPHTSVVHLGLSVTACRSSRYTCFVVLERPCNDQVTFLVFLLLPPHCCISFGLATPLFICAYTRLFGIFRRAPNMHYLFSTCTLMGLSRMIQILYQDFSCLFTTSFTITPLSSADNFYVSAE